MKGRAEAYGRVRKVIGQSNASTVGVDYAHMHSEQEKEEEVGMPIVVVKESKTKMIVAKSVPSKGVENYAVEAVKRAVERLGHRRLIVSSDNELAILALKEAVRRDTDVEIVLRRRP